MANFKSVDRIITAKDYGGSARAYIRKQQRIKHQHGITVTIKDLDKEPTGAPVYARIWQGQWIADCECKGASFVDPDEPVFFCFGCGNRAHGQQLRPVIFPPTLERLEIERLLLERPVDDLAGLTDAERAGMAKPLLFAEIEVADMPSTQEVLQALQHGETPQPGKRMIMVPLTRSWETGETIETLRQQQDAAVKAFQRDLREGKAKRNGIQ
jgi:hypothetical protein